MDPNEQLIVRCSAPGKIILHGEHSVVYGKLAIASSLDLRTFITITEDKTDKLSIDFVDLNLRRSFDLSRIKMFHQTGDVFNPDGIEQKEWLEQIRDLLEIPPEMPDNQLNSLISLLFLYYGIVFSSGVELAGFSVKIMTDLTLGSGTGSSASLMVSLSGAFLHYVALKKPELQDKFGIIQGKYEGFNETQLKLISRWGFQAERIIHGNPSGIDNTVCTYGSLVSFRKGRAPFPLKCGREITGVIVDTCVPKNTATQVRKVVELRGRYPKIVENVLDGLEHVADESLEVLMKIGDGKTPGDELGQLYRDLGGLSTINHHLLQTLGVSHPSLDKSIQIMDEFGLKGKMTGAGGGGYSIALIPPYIQLEKVQDLCSRLEEQGFKGRIIKLGGSGVCYH